MKYEIKEESRKDVLVYKAKNSDGFALVEGNEYVHYFSSKQSDSQYFLIGLLWKMQMEVEGKIKKDNTMAENGFTLPVVFVYKKEEDDTEKPLVLIDEDGFVKKVNENWEIIENKTFLEEQIKFSTEKCKELIKKRRNTLNLCEEEYKAKFQRDVEFLEMKQKELEEIKNG